MWGRLSLYYRRVNYNKDILKDLSALNSDSAARRRRRFRPARKSDSDAAENLLRRNTESARVNSYPARNVALQDLTAAVRTHFNFRFAAIMARVDRGLRQNIFFNLS
jgi:hypothetical protein